MGIPWSKAGSTIYEIATAPMGPRNDVEFLGFAMTVFFGGIAMAASPTGGLKTRPYSRFSSLRGLKIFTSLRGAQRRGNLLRILSHPLAPSF